MSRKVSILLMVALAVGAFAAVAVMRQDPAPDTAAFPYTLVDDAGVTVTVRERPRRVITLGPHLTETMFRLGVGDSVVGAAGTPGVPAEAASVPSVLAEDGLPNTVRIGELAPDLVLVAGAAQGEASQRFRAAGIAVVTLQATGVSDALADLSKVGRLVGRGPQAQRMVDGIRAALKRESVAGDTAVFVESFFPPLTHPGSRGYLADLVAAAGGRLVAPSQGPGETTPGEVAGLSPRLYLAPTAGAEDQTIATRPGFAAIEAVSRGKIALISEDLLFYPGPRMVDAVRAIKEAIAKHAEP